MPKKILTVDDSKTIRLIVARAFKPFDCEILEGANGIEGLTAAAKEKPDIIILDLTMPVMDGYEMLMKLKESPELKNIPVIMLTAEAGKDNVLRIAKLGVRDYLIKPFKEDLILERVGRVIELKPKPTAAGAAKKYEDPLRVLVVDDKPAIIEQIRGALARTPWKIEGLAQTNAALEQCSKQLPDAVLVSLSLPDNAAFTFFAALRSNPKTQAVPVLGVSVKTAQLEQDKAQQAGFNAVLTKPIDAEDLHDRLVTAFKLDLSGRYFQHRDGLLAVTVPAGFTPAVADQINQCLQAKITQAVDAGLDKVVVDMSQLRSADQSLVRLGARIVKLCRDLGLHLCLVGSDAVIADCVNFAETQSWHFVSNWPDALASFARKEAA